MAGWLVAWVLRQCMLVRSTTVWLLPFTLLYLPLSIYGKNAIAHTTCYG